MGSKPLGPRFEYKHALNSAIWVQYLDLTTHFPRIECSATAGLETEQSERNTTAYLQHWISALKQDSRLIVQAAASAQRAVDMITGPSVMHD
jgi:antirestriction protein ArdC